MYRCLSLGLCGALAVAAALAGDEACAACHPGQVRTFRNSGMGKSILPPPTVRMPVTVAGPAGVSYRTLVREESSYQESLRGGSVLESHRILYGIGSGEHGTSYVIARGDSLFMAPLSYYTKKAAWDLSPGFESGAYRDFLRPVTTSCLFCHAALPQTEPIGCKRCHGSGDAHARRPSVTMTNPAKLAPERRDDVCNQCHLGGDLRILKPGRTEPDFHPGMLLRDVVEIFSLPPAFKPEGMDAVGQTGQLRMSRCWKESQGKLACITCHDPHSNRSGAAAANHYRSRCEQCHQQRTCTAPVRRRNATSPPNDCAACHMPKSPLNRIAHIAHTNHRILRRPELALDPSLDSSGGLELICETGPQPDLRSRALAYAQAARGLPQWAAAANRLLDAALVANAHDAEVTAHAGLLRRDPALLKALLKKAVELGSRSADVRVALCELEQSAARCREAIDLAPYEPASYVQLIGSYLAAGDRASAVEWLARLRAFDPANPEIAALTRRTGGPQ